MAGDFSMISYQLHNTFSFITVLYTTRNDRGDCDTTGLPLELP